MRQLPSVLLTVVTLDSDNEPIEEIGARCKNPFECDYKSHCWKKVPEYSVYNVFSAKKADTIAKIIESYEIKDIPPKLIPGGIQKIDIEAYLTGNIIAEKENIRAFLS